MATSILIVAIVLSAFLGLARYWIDAYRQKQRRLETRRDIKRTAARRRHHVSIVQMPGGVPVGTLAIGEAGAKNAGLLAVRILAGSRPELRGKLHEFHQRQTAKVMEDSQL